MSTLHRFFIPHRLPDFNEIINTTKTHKMAYSSLKKRATNRCAIVFMKAPKFESIYVKFTWVEKSRHRDKDNIAAGRKFIFDGMIQAGMIPNDGWGEVLGWADDFKVDKIKPGVLVDVWEGGSYEYRENDKWFM